MSPAPFIVWFVIFILWSVYRAYFHFPNTVDEFIAKPIIFLAPVIYVTLKNKEKLSSLGFSVKLKSMMLDFYIGAVIGILFVFEGLFANFIKYGHYLFLPILTAKVSGGVVPFLVINLVTAIVEEILGRGYLYQKFFSESKNQLGAALISSWIFLLLHIPIILISLRFSGMTLITYIFSIFLLSLTNCYLYTWRKSLVLPILIHTFWSMTVALYL